MQIGVKQPGATYDYEIDNAELDQRAKVAEALRTGALAPMGESQMVSGRVIKRSPLEGLAKVVQAYMANNQKEGIKKERDELSQRYGQDIEQGMRKLSLGMNGGQDAVVGPEGPELKQFAADPKAAISEALASRNPVVRDYAIKQQEAMAKQQQEQWKQLAGQAMPGDVQQFPNDPSKWRMKPDFQSINPDQVAIDRSSGKVGLPEGANVGSTMVNGDMHRTINGVLGKELNSAPRNTTNVSVSPTAILGAGQREGSKQAFEMAGKAIQKMADTYEATGNMKNQVATMRDLDAKGIFSGKAAGILTDAAGWADAFNVPLSADVKAKLSNAETYNAGAEQLAQAFLRTIDGNKFLTGPEAADAKKAIVNQKLSPEARQNLYRIMDTAHARAEKLYMEALPAYNAAVKADDPTLFDYGKFLKGTQGQNATQVPNPEVGTQTGGGGTRMKLGDALTKYGIQ